MRKCCIVLQPSTVSLWDVYACNPDYCWFLYATSSLVTWLRSWINTTNSSVCTENKHVMYFSSYSFFRTQSKKNRWSLPFLETKNDTMDNFLNNQKISLWRKHSFSFFIYIIKSFNHGMLLFISCSIMFSQATLHLFAIFAFRCYDTTLWYTTSLLILQEAGVQKRNQCIVTVHYRIVITTFLNQVPYLKPCALYCL